MCGGGISGGAGIGGFGRAFGSAFNRSGSSRDTQVNSSSSVDGMVDFGTPGVEGPGPGAGSNDFTNEQTGFGGGSGTGGSTLGGSTLSGVIGVDDPSLTDPTGPVEGVSATSAVISAARAVDRARAAAVGVQEIDFGTLSLRPNAVVSNPDLVSKNVQFQEEDSLRTFTKNMNPLNPQGGSLPGNIVGLAGLAFAPGVGTVAKGIVEGINAAVNPESFNITDPGGSLNIEARDTSVRSPKGPNNDSGGNFITGPSIQKPKTTAAKTAAVKPASTTSTRRSKRTQKSTIASSIFGDTSAVNILRARLGGR